MTSKNSYLSASRSPTYGFLISLPLLATYELLIAFVNRGSLQQIRIGAEVWVKQLVATIGVTGVPVLAIGVVAAGIIVMLAERKRRPVLHARYFLWSLVESTIYATGLAFLVSAAVGALFAMAPQGTLADQPGLTQIALSLGAGLYEELVFRVILVGGLFWLLKAVFGASGTTRQRDLRLVASYLLAAVIGAAAFSAVHYVGAFGDPFSMASFTYRFLFGLALNAVFLLRGFGIAAWTHAIYDIMVVVGVWN